jgi:hypothetical protein
MTGRFRQLINRVRAFFRKEPLDHEFSAEVASHLELAIEENVQRGLSPEEGRRQALVRFGGVEQAREQHRETRGLPQFDIFMQDLRYAFRTLRRDRAFTIVAVLILALGIAANVTVFSVVNTILLRPLPFPNAQQLTWLASDRQLTAAQRGSAGLSAVTYTVDAYEEFQRHQHSFQQVTSYNPFFGNSEYTLTGRGDAQAITGVMVAENFFQTLGVQPVLGRYMSKEECQKGGRPAVLLSYAFWQRQFGGDPAIVGQAINFGKQAVTVVGVLPSTFDFGSVFSPGLRFDIFVPAVMDQMRTWGNTLALIGRLKPGVSVAQAQGGGGCPVSAAQSRASRVVERLLIDHHRT